MKKQFQWKGVSSRLTSSHANEAYTKLIRIPSLKLGLRPHKLPLPRPYTTQPEGSRFSWISLCQPWCGLRPHEACMCFLANVTLLPMWKWTVEVVLLVEYNRIRLIESVVKFSLVKISICHPKSGDTKLLKETLESFLKSVMQTNTY